MDCHESNQSKIVWQPLSIVNKEWIERELIVVHVEHVKSYGARIV